LLEALEARLIARRLARCHSIRDLRRLAKRHVPKGPFDYMDERQTPFLYDMHQVMGKPMVVTINIAQAMAVCENDLDVFLRWHPIWKRNPESISFYSLCDYAMLGVSKPITSSGALASYLSQSFGAYILFKLFDPEVDVLPRLSAGTPVDLQQMGWAFGSPRTHLYDFLTARALPALCGLDPDPA